MLPLSVSDTTLDIVSDSVSRWLRSDVYSNASYDSRGVATRLAEDVRSRGYIKVMGERHERGVTSPRTQPRLPMEPLDQQSQFRHQ